MHQFTRSACWLTAMSAAPVLALCFAASMATPLHADAGPAVEPIILMDAGNVRACGVSIKFNDNPSGRYQLLVEREGANAMLTIRANAPLEISRPEGASESVSANKIVLCRPTLETRTISSGSLIKSEPVQGNEFIELSTAATSDAVASLIQELMSGGGEFMCEHPLRKERVYRLPGPLPQQARAAYLNCAGDLFRPEEQRK